MTMQYRIEPLGPWLDPITEPRVSSGRFRAPWGKTLQLLAREVDALGGDLVVIQVDTDLSQIRRDGMLRADARMGRFPGVRCSFRSVHGPLTYATDVYQQMRSDDPPSWQSNVRAIALGLEALRAVDRHGVSTRGQQYRGWLAIEGPNGAMSSQAARELVDSYGGLRQALHDAHPDHGGSVEAFQAVLAARRALKAVGVPIDGEPSP